MAQTTIQYLAQAKQKRLFFAIYPDSDVRKLLYEVQASFSTATAQIVPPNNLHLTLAFLGNTTAEQYECYLHAADTVTIPKFNVRLDQFGFFDKKQLCYLTPSVIPTELKKLHKNLKHTILRCGYHDRRKFKPHLTLFRKATKLIWPTEILEIKLHVDRFFLIESIQKSGGVIYIPREEYKNDTSL